MGHSACGIAPFLFVYVVQALQHNHTWAVADADRPSFLTQVPGCTADLAAEPKLYCLRKRICTKHMQVCTCAAYGAGRFLLALEVSAGCWNKGPKCSKSAARKL